MGLASLCDRNELDDNDSISLRTLILHHVYPLSTWFVCALLSVLCTLISMHIFIVMIGLRSNLAYANKASFNIEVTRAAMQQRDPINKNKGLYRSICLRKKIRIRNQS